MSFGVGVNILYRFAAIQILVYMFIAPVLRSSFFDTGIEYVYSVSVVFMVFFLIGGSLQVFGFLNRPKCESRVDFEFSRIGVAFSFIWVAVVVGISFEYGLYDRRITTESAAELFGSFPVATLVAFRTLEISLPLLTSVILIKKLNFGNLQFREKMITGLLLASFFALGAANSRSSTVFFVVIILAVIQNRVPVSRVSRLVKVGALIGVLAMVLVSISRFNNDDGRQFSEYLSAEVLQRLDGLELISEVVRRHGLDFFGVSWEVALKPILSRLVFLEESSALKSEGLTTIKSVVLAEEFGSNLRDYNSFIVFDVYYLAGFFGVIIFGFVLGWLCRVIDNRFALSRSRFVFVGVIAVASNIVILEREFIGVMFSIFRDFVILMVVSYIFLVRSRRRYSQL